MLPAHISHLISVSRHGTAQTSSKTVHPGVVAAVAHPRHGVGGAVLSLGAARLHVASPHSPGVGQNGLMKNGSLTFTAQSESRTHLYPVSSLIVDTAPADKLREVVDDGPGRAGHLTEETGLLTVEGGHLQ